MAIVFPNIEEIKKLKVPPTEGEMAILEYLEKNLSNEFEVFFQPFLNGDFPDIVILREGYKILIIEVKDWNLKLYSIDEKNRWFVCNNKTTRIKSPFSQVFNYKKNIFDIHVKGFVEKSVINNNFYKMIDVAVYFYKSNKNEINFLFSIVEKKISNEIFKLNERRKCIPYDKYEKEYNYLITKLKNIKRDKSISVSSENLENLVRKIDKNRLHRKEEYDEIKRCLNPPDHIKEEGKDIIYSKQQEKYIKSDYGFSKIKGVAGSGKTIVLAKKAVNAHIRHGGCVLILTYNISLRNYIYEKISNVREDFNWKFFIFNNYHNFIFQQLNTLGVDVEIDDNNMINLDTLYLSNINLFKEYSEECLKFDTILIDEIQDFKKEWIKILRDNFLRDNGEMVLFGDECQSLYNNLGHTVQGFGIWGKLSKNYRIKNNSLMLPLIKLFYNNFLQNKYNESVHINEEVGIQKTFDVFRSGYIFSRHNDIKLICDNIFKYIRNNNFSNNDVTIISSRIEILQKIDKHIRDTTCFETHTVFEDTETLKEITLHLENKINKNQNNISQINRLKAEFKKNIQKIRKNKKNHFYSNSGKIKLSTTHSFKGFESTAIIYIALKGEEPEMIYTALTRARFSILLILEQGSEYIEFFKNNAGFEFDIIK